PDAASLRVHHLSTPAQVTVHYRTRPGVGWSARLPGDPAGAVLPFPPAPEGAVVQFSVPAVQGETVESLPDVTEILLQAEEEAGVWIERISLQL
ncbi:MAG: hypothetical protein D6790_00620, partial [Caldilineae bacterium]